MKVKLIVAVDVNNGIGKDNKLPWHLPADMKFFKEMTTNQIVIMGRKNYESIPEKFRPLPNRVNIVLSHDQDYKALGCIVCTSIQQALDHIVQVDFGSREVYVIGGAEIYKAFIDNDLVNEMIVTHINEEFDCDTFFPEIDLSKWRPVQLIERGVDESNDIDFVVNSYTRI